MKYPNHYGAIGVHKQATDAEIKAAYGALASQWHPDRNANSPDSARKMADLNVAYNVLKNQKERDKYDKMLSLMGGRCFKCDGNGATKKQKGFDNFKWVPCAVCAGSGTRQEGA